MKENNQSWSARSKHIFYLVALIIRFVVVYIAKLIDESPSPKKYTDTDYDVFSDAAIHVSNGNSPYARHTYRYTPLAAYMCLPNVWIHPLCGKIIFCIFDVIMAATMWELIESQNRNHKNTWLYVSFWLYNPVTIAMSTRGSNDNIIAMLVYITLYYLLKKEYVKAAFWYGLSVHFKIYPIIYSFVFYLFIDLDRKAILERKSSIWKNFFTQNRITFTLVSAFTFIAFTGVFYAIYGYEFLYESLLYHFIRKDNRHNYSVYFYTIYQMYDRQSSTMFAILAFVPQWSVMLCTGFLFYYDLFFAMLIQTWAFVVFNKVVTEQYFLWYMSLIPFVCINNGIIQNASFAGYKGVLGISIYAIHLVCLPIWSYHSFLIEHMGQNVFDKINYVNYGFFIINIVFMGIVIKNHQLTITNEIESQSNKKKVAAKKE